MRSPPRGPVAGLASATSVVEAATPARSRHSLSLMIVGPEAEIGSTSARQVAEAHERATGRSGEGGFTVSNIVRLTGVNGRPSEATPRRADQHSTRSTGTRRSQLYHSGSSEKLNFYSEMCPLVDPSRVCSAARRFSHRCSTASPGAPAWPCWAASWPSPPGGACARLRPRNLGHVAQRGELDGFIGSGRAALAGRERAPHAPIGRKLAQ